MCKQKTHHSLADWFLATQLEDHLEPNEGDPYGLCTQATNPYPLEPCPPFPDGLFTPEVNCSHSPHLSLTGSSPTLGDFPFTSKEKDAGSASPSRLLMSYN
jgi:hypothetical protein